MTNAIEAWHFVGDTLRDGRPVPADGEWLEYGGGVVICRSGLHASERLIDALAYAPGGTICRVTCDDIVAREDDKFACRRRRIDWRVDGEDILREFARECALDVAHLWAMPDTVRQYLETGDEDRRKAAGAAARVATRNAAWDDARAATRDAAWAAAGAAWAAAGAAASDAAWAAVWAAKDAARVATRAAAWDDARAAASDAAWAAARDAARAAQNERLILKVMQSRAA